MFTADALNAYDSLIATLDPLEADDLMARLPGANAAADVAVLADMANELAGRSTRIQSAQDACAGLRDLGLVISSLGRHRPDILENCPWQEHLVRLGTLADEIPRETVYSYSSRNPDGRRQRRFTNTAEEGLFIASVREGIRHLNVAVEILVRDLSAPVDADRLAAALAGLNARLRDFAACLIEVKRGVTPDFFTTHLRPYFPPLVVSGRTYFGPGGAQMPQLVLDVLLLRPAPAAPLAQWHECYVADNAVYLPAAHRRVIDDALTAPSGLVAQMTGADAGGAQVALAALRTVVSSILRFRYPHQRMAAANMAIRPTGSIGSGGYSLEAVDQLVELTTDALVQLDRKVTK